MTKTKSKSAGVGTAVLSLVSLVFTVVLLMAMLPCVGAGKQSVQRITVPDPEERYERLISFDPTFVPTAAAEPVRDIRRLNDADIIAPVPDPEKYGRASDASELTAVIDEAKELLEGQTLYFSAERNLLPGSEIRYYLDDSILVITWKEPLDTVVLTFAEVRIADGSQFRRFLAGGQFGAETQYVTTEMAKTVNAVLASSGDFYKFRYNGVVVYEGEVRRVNTNKADTCYIDDRGDLIFTYQNTVMTHEEAQRFVDDNHIRFSLTFGPVLVDDGQRCEPANYDLGEVNSFSPRAALCQMDTCHYLVVTSNAEPNYPGALNIHQFAQRIAQTGCRKAYTLDGGQTAAIALDGSLVNNVLYGQQRPISDIIYFATSAVEGG